MNQLINSLFLTVSFILLTLFNACSDVSFSPDSSKAGGGALVGLNSGNGANNGNGVNNGQGTANNSNVIDNTTDQGMAPFGDRLREVSYRRKKQFAALELDGELVCEIDFNHNHIHLVREGGFANMVNVELITGPALIIVMASLKTYCLHASAVATPQGNLVFVGESGVGKSTLAWQAGDAWQQTADDIIPVLYEKGRSGVRLSADFPQLKLENAKAPGVVASDGTIDYIFRIRPEPSKTIEFKKLSKAEGMLQFVRHTVGAKLFDTSMMKRHTKFANYVVNKVVFIELAYPRDLLGLTDLREEILEYLKTI